MRKVILGIVLICLTGCVSLDMIKGVIPVWGGGSDKEDVEEFKEDLPFEWSEVKWCSSGSDNVGDWPVTLHIVSGDISRGDRVTWAYRDAAEVAHQASWRRTKRIHREPNGCVGWVAQINGKWYGAIGEWLLPRQTWQSKKMFKSDRGNTRMFQSPLRDYVPERGQVFYFFVCGLDRNLLRNVQERSTLFKMTYK